MLWIRRYIQVIPVLIWFLLLSTGAYAYSQLSNLPTVPADGLSVGAGGLAVTNITYTLSTADPSQIAMVTFMLTPISSSARFPPVRAKLVSASNGYSPCANTPVGSNIWECAISGVTVAAADQLSVDVVDLPAVTPYVLRLPLIVRPGNTRPLPLVAR